MNKTLKLAICTGITFPLFASAQVVVNAPETASTASVANSTFHNLVIAMSEDADALFTPEGDSLSLSNSIYFNYMASAPGFIGTWDAAAGAPPTIEFQLVSNFPFFTFGEQGTLDIGFIGEESKHDNTFGFVEDGNYTELYNWNAGGDVAPISYQLTSATQTAISFRQENNTVGGAAGIGLQADSNRFRIYAVVEDGEQTGEYLFAIADRDGTEDGDYDDGFFYVIGDITPVPEPSQIAAIALAGLGGLLLVRRRIMRRRK